jgi:hypothetical protein
LTKISASAQLTVVEPIEEAALHVVDSERSQGLCGDCLMVVRIAVVGDRRTLDIGAAAVSASRVTVWLTRNRSHDAQAE